MRAKKGFTLIELIVAMVLATMLLGALIPLLVTAQKSTYDAQKKTRAAQAGEAIYTYIAGQLRSAERVFLGDGTQAPADPPAEQWNQITVGANGCLSVNGVTPYPESYQEGAALTLTAQGHDRTALDLTVRLGDLYDKTSSFSLQNLIRTGFSQTEGIVGQALSAPAASGGALTIYYLGGDGAVSVFPTPDPDPDGSHTPPAEDQLTVTILNKSLRVKAGETAEVRAYIHVPAGKNVTYEWTSAEDSFVTPVVTSSPLTGELNASGTVILAVYGTKVTEEGKPVTVALKATVSETAESKQDACAVTVYETEPATANDKLILHYKDSPTGDAYNNNIAQQTVFWEIGSYKNGFTLSLSQNDGSNLLKGEWSILDADSDATRQSFEKQLPAGSAESYHYKSQPPRGWVTIKAKVAGKGDNLTHTDLIGEWTYTTIVFYDAKDYTLRTVFSDGARNRTLDLPAAPATGQTAESAVLTVTAKDATAAELLRKILPSLQGELVDDYDAWPGNSLLQQPAASPAFAQQPGGRTFVCTLPLAYRREIKNGDAGEIVWPLYGRLTFSTGGAVFLKDKYALKLTVKKLKFPLTAPKLVFLDSLGSTDVSSLTEEYREGFYVEAELRFTFGSSTNQTTKAAVAEYFKGQRAAIYCETLGSDWPWDPLVKEPLGTVEVATKAGESYEKSGGDVVLSALFRLQLARPPKDGEERVTFVAALVDDPSIWASGTLTVKDPANSMVLRLDKGDGTGMLLTRQTLLVNQAFDGLYISAYESETSTQALTGGTWKKVDRKIENFTTTRISNRWVSEPIDDGTAYYHDKQNGQTIKREPKGWSMFPTPDGNDGDYVNSAHLTKCWDDYNWAKIIYTAPDGKTVSTTLRVQKTTQKYETGLKASGSAQISAGQPATLTLNTAYEKAATYKVAWSVDKAGLLECPSQADYQTGSDGKDNRTVTLQPAAGAAVEKATPVTVTATWQSGDGSLLGQSSVTLTVNPTKK